MKRSIPIALALCAALATSSYAAAGPRMTYMMDRDSSVVAPDRVGRWDWGINIAAGFNDRSDDTAFYSTSIAYGVTPWIALGAEAGWQEASLSNTEDLGLVPVLADIIIRVPTVNATVVPYMVVGLGVMGAYVTDTNNNDSDNTSFGWKLGGGVDWFLNERWILNLELAYYGSSADLPRSSAGDSTSFWTLGGGLKYVF